MPFFILFFENNMSLLFNNAMKSKPKSSIEICAVKKVNNPGWTIWRKAKKTWEEEVKKQKRKNMGWILFLLTSLNY